MCYNITINKKIEYLEKRFRATFENPQLFEPIYHVSAFSTPFLPVISNKDSNTIQLFQWGLIPFWVKDEDGAEKIRFRTFNARSETVHEKPSYRMPIKKRRCIVIADGFYESREVQGKKYPYFIRLADNSAFALAGIWDTWVNKKTQEKNNTFSIITTRANPLIEKIHNIKKRMPVILKREHENKWLSENLNTDEINSMLDPYDENEMEAYTVSKLITARGINTNVPEAMKLFEYKEVPNIN